MAAQVSIPVANVADLIDLGHTRIEVWWSQDEGRNYYEVTASTAKPAVLTSKKAENTYLIGGRSLVISVNGGAEELIEFSAILQYWTPQDVANKINETIPGLATVVDACVVLTSPTTGRASTLRIVYCDASEQLGFEAAVSVRGQDARPVLNALVLIYQFFDVGGMQSDRYKWRFSADGVEPISGFTERILGEVPILADTSVCTANFVGLDGRPQQRRIVVVSDNLQPIGGYAIGSQNPLVVDSDENGFLQIPLVIGVKVRVAIEGTAFVREFVVPNSPSFDLLQVMASAPDPFTVQTTPPFLIRRSL